MSIYQLHVITAEGKQVFGLPQDGTLKLSTQDNTKYQIFNEQGELVAEPHIKPLNTQDLAVFLEEAGQPRLILENYLSHYPIESSAYLSEISASLATASKEAPLVLASEVASVGVTQAAISSSLILAGVVGTGAVIGGVALASSQRSSKTADQPTTAVATDRESTTSAVTQTSTVQPVDIKPIAVNVHLATVTADNVVNAAELAGRITLSGSFQADQPFTQASAAFVIGGQTIPAQVSGTRFQAEVDGKLIAAHTQIEAVVKVTSATTSGEGQQSQTYRLDDSFKVSVSVDTIAAEDTINQVVAADFVTLSGRYTTDRDVKADSVAVTVSLNGEEVPAVVNETTQTWQLQVEGQSLVTAQGENHLVVKISAQDVAGNVASARAERPYIVDTEIASPILTLSPIAADDILNAVETKQESIDIHGQVENVPGSEAKAGDKVMVTIGELTQMALLDDKLSFTLPVSTLALVNHKAISVSLTTQDAMQNTNQVDVVRTVTVDKTFEVSVSVDNITLDNTVNKVESAGQLTLSGRYTADSDLKAGSVAVMVTLGGKAEQATVDEATQTWQLVVSGQSLATAQGENRLQVAISAQDVAGNTTSTSEAHRYQVDTVLAKPVVTITSIAGDDVIDASEAKGAITIRGVVENAEGDEPVLLRCPCLTCSGGWKEVEAPVTDGQFEITVTVADTSLANARLKSAERLIKANYTAKDAAGNSEAADEASRAYQLELDREVDITHIGSGFDLSPNATTRIYGKIEEFGTLNGRNSNIYNEGLNARFIRSLHVKIGEKTYQVGFNSVEKTFYLDVPNSDLADLAGKAVSLDFNVLLTTGRDRGVSYYTGDVVLNTLTTNADGSKTVTSVGGGYIPTATKFTLTSDMLVKNGDNSYQVKDFSPEKTEIRGVVKGDVAVGELVELSIGTEKITTDVKPGKTFAVEVDTALLQQNTSQAVTASLKNENMVSDTEHYAASQSNSAEFKSPHGLVAGANRRIDHTKDDYNFFHPIHLSEMNGGRGGFLNSYNPATNQAPIVIKYHFATDEEFINLPESTQGFEITNIGSRKAVADGLKTLLKERIYKEISEKTNIRFEEGSLEEVTNGKGSLIYAAEFKAGTYAAGSPAIGFGGGNVIWGANVNVDQSDYVYQVAMHEVLHTLSLDHTHVRFLSGGVNYRGEETLEFSNLSYFRPRILLGLRDLRMFDMAYLHYRLGVNAEHRKGNDVYTFKTYDALKSDGDIYIWDGNGVDTFDASAEKQGVTVNLTPGSWIYRGEKKKHFIVEGHQDSDAKAFFGLAADDKVTGTLNNRGSTYYGGDDNPPANHARFGNYLFDGQAFIGYGTQIENLIGSAHNDTLTGNNADNNIFGGQGDDVIRGGLGNDFLNGGEGIDMLFGESGDDSYVVDSLGDVVVEKAGEGDADHIYSFINYELEDGENDHIEHLTLIGTTATDASGNALNNTLRGNDTGNTLKGMGGDDTLIGGLGKDTLTGGEGNDTFVFESALNGKADIITDFVRGEDKIKLSASVFGALQADLSNLSQHLFYNAANGELSYSSTANAESSATHFVTVMGLQALSSEQFILG